MLDVRIYLHFLLMLVVGVGFGVPCLIADVDKDAVVELQNGSELRGKIVLERGDRIWVDLGFTLLSVAREDILAIREVSIQAMGVSRSDALYETVSHPERKPVRDWVEQHGEAVVLVQTPTGLGSGFVIHPEGYIITNDHVIAGEHQIMVTLFKMESGGMERIGFQNVRILASSPEQDLALLKVEDGGDYLFQTVPIGESDQLQPGEKVFAVGSPLGLERTVSEGIVSLRNRLIGGRLYIQQTAEINPGNSGGPLFNLKGEVVGVNNMKIVASGAEGLGFAIPSNVLKIFLRNRDAFAFDPRNPNAGFRYNTPPTDVNPVKTTP